MSAITIIGLIISAVGLLSMIENGRSDVSTSCLVGGLALAAYGTLP